MVIPSLNSIQHPHSPSLFSSPPTIDLSHPDSHSHLVQACQDFGFFKIVNHGVPPHLIATLQSLALDFFSNPDQNKNNPSHLGYGKNKIGSNGDVGWVEYLLLTSHDFRSHSTGDNFRAVANEYVSAVRKMACEILEMLADGLNVQPRNAFSKLLMDEQSDSVFRVNHYPPCPGTSPVIGFGEHTDPQIISVLRSNNTSGLQILLKDGRWISVPPDEESFFINVGDSLQVMTNGRFKSVKHRVVANSPESRLSMIYFGGPPLSEKIAPLPALVSRGEDSLYKEFTWYEYKQSLYSSRLSDNRLGLFEKIAAS